MNCEKVLQDVYSALRATSVLPTLREVFSRELAAGTSRDSLIALSEDLRIHLRADNREDDEDAILEVMDMLVGWCGPDERL